MLLKAVENGNLALVKDLAQKGADLQIRVDNDETLLHKASYHGRTEVMLYLVSKGLGVDVPDRLGFTPLHEAARAGEMKAAEVLLSLGANPQARTNADKSAADLAEEKGAKAIVHLIRNGGYKRMWRKTAEDEVVLVTPRPETGYKMTEIFNFSARSYILITQNTLSGNEAVVMKTFSDFSDTEHLQTAEREFISLGGKLPEGYQPRNINKPKISLPGRRLA
jgi:hypothetical protein